MAVPVDVRGGSSLVAEVVRVRAPRRETAADDFACVRSGGMPAMDFSWCFVVFSKLGMDASSACV